VLTELMEFSDLGSEERKELKEIGPGKTEV
jgi:hypothetical protein